ncbi:lipase 1 [[Candida] anglica]|uniref:Lipase 1 n=1 Tax=[Candida] anglica TaxID=148631 RepID=A0ABP0EGS9_9ASCO
MLSIYILIYTTLVTRVLATHLKVIPPSLDPFYNPPDGYQNKHLGEILRFRRVPNKLRGIYFPINIKNAWHIMSRSSDSMGNPSTVVTTLIEPYNSNSSRLVSYQFMEDSSMENCAISYGMQFGADMDTLVTQEEMYLLNMALQEGYWVNAPDYLGPKSTFTVSRQHGQAVLDSLRSVLNSANETGVSPEADIILWGYSGGSMASSAAASIRKQYAPELKPRLVGAVFGGFFTNVTDLLLAVDGSAYAGLIATSLGGLSNEYTALKSIYNISFSRKGAREAFWANTERCFAPSLAAMMYTQVFSGPTKWVRDSFNFFSQPLVKEILFNTTIGIDKAEKPDIPIFIYHGKNDSIVPLNGAKQTFNNWCDWGVESVEMTVSNSTRHITECFLGSPAAMTWIKRRFNGKPPVEGCSYTERVSNMSYPGTSLSSVNLVVTFVKTLFGLKIGPWTFKKREDFEAFDIDSKFEERLKIKNSY